VGVWHCMGAGVGQQLTLLELLVIVVLLLIPLEVVVIVGSLLLVLLVVLQRNAQRIAGPVLLLHAAHDCRQPLRNGGRYTKCRQAGRQAGNSSSSSSAPPHHLPAAAHRC
jgi:hypothetical protein